MHVPSMSYAALTVTLCLCAAGCSRDPEARSREYLASGDRYIASKQYKQAIVEYGNAVQQDPRSGEAHLKLADAYARVGDGAASARAYVRAAELRPNDARVQVIVGQIELLSGDFEAARARADRVLASYSRNVDAQILRANALAGLRDLNAAVDQIQAAAFSDPDRSDTYTNLGSLQLAQGNREEAEKAFIRAVRIAPHSAPARLALANFYWSTGRTGNAEQTLRQALAGPEKDPIIDRALALLYLTTGREAAAEPFLVRAAKTAADDDTKVALAEYYVLVGRQAEALRLLEPIAAGAANESGTAIARIAEIHVREGREEEALQRLDDFLRKSPTNGTALVAKARLLLMRHSPDEALDTARRAVRAEPDLLPGWLTLARVQVARGATEEAVEVLERALASRASFVPAQLELAQLHLAAGREEEALPLVDGVIELHPDHVDAHFVRAHALFAIGRLEDAKAVLSGMAARHAETASVQARLGSQYASWGEWRYARAAYARSLQLDPLNIDAHAGLAALDFAEGAGRRAQTRVEHALARKPDDLGLMLIGARAAFELRDFGAAERRVRRVIERDAANLPAYTLLGQIFAAQGRLAEATRQFEHVARQRPRSVPVNTALGMLLETQGKEAEARKRYEAVLLIDPQAPVAANNLAWLLTKEGGDLDRARQLARTAHARLKERPEVNHTLGWIHYKAGAASEAVPLLRHAADKQPTKPLYRLHLGLAYAGAGDEARACEALARTLRLDPDASAAAEARRAAEGLKGCRLSAPRGSLRSSASRTSRTSRSPR